MLRQLSFQFTPLYERRLRFQYTPSLQKVFQFTPLHERQPIRATAHFGCMEISIHASTREATLTLIGKAAVCAISIHAST